MPSVGQGLQCLGLAIWLSLVIVEGRYKVKMTFFGN
jgi:hypothetical protein